MRNNETIALFQDTQANDPEAHKFHIDDKSRKIVKKIGRVSMPRAQVINILPQRTSIWNFPFLITFLSLWCNMVFNC